MNHAMTMSLESESYFQQSESPSCAETTAQNHFREALQDAIRSRRLDVYYQPQANLRDGSFGHFEALVRWIDPRYGFVSPATFIPLAEEMGLIDEITEFVIGRVLNDLSNWRAAQVPIDSVAINISAKHFANTDRAEKLLAWLSDAQHASKSIILELTETAMLGYSEVTRKYVADLHNLGFAIALDDFGTGYSSVAHLLEFPISTIKIDRSFVSTIMHSLKCQTIVRALIDLANALSVDIVAEGVERVEELRMLKSMGCSFAQGYLFSKPLPEAQVAEYLNLLSNRQSLMAA